MIRKLTRAKIFTKMGTVSVILFLLVLMVVICCACTDGENGITENVYNISPTLCNTLFSCTPKEFYLTKGRTTLLKDNFTNAEMDENGNLVLELSEEQKEQWIAVSFHMQVFYKILDENSGKKQHPFLLNMTDSLREMLETQIELSESDTIRKTFIQDKECFDYDISDDYTKVVVDYNDDGLALIAVLPACIHMQVLNGIESNDIRVELVRLNEDGSVMSVDVWHAGILE